MLKDDRDVLHAKISSVIWNAYTPSEAIGWPPGMLDHLRSMIHNVALVIADSVYTEQELDTKVENILLSTPQQI